MKNITVINIEMCIVFILFDPYNIVGPYKFILAANRDEYYSRLSKPADFWCHNSIVSGLDLQTKNADGTWLGMNRLGKISAITNYLQPTENPNATSRGYLVSNYLTSEVDSYEYLLDVSRNGHLYNGFNIITASLGNGPDKLCYYSNRSNKPPKELTQGIYGISNSLLDVPWTKLTYGKKKFTDIVTYQDCSSDKLTGSLLSLLNDTTPLPIDPAIEIQGQDFIRPILKEFSAVCVRAKGYGSRTNTVIIVDSDYNVSFTERTMLDTEAKEWKTSNFIFSIDIKK
ncbi:T10-like protein [Finch poxvirus]|uniref:T10-like protein n=1 Tax=Condorpox virus TaxID=3049970 RepID=A0AAT9UPC1_9POXV|nr:T10-like protein [Finch poxvirus]UOX39045.1 T10-like protein [Finch poxvirus]